MIFHVTLEQAEDGWFVVECPALPGCVSQDNSLLSKRPEHQHSAVMG